MTKPNKQRAGLQKKVSSVFNGVSIPGGKRAGKPSRTPAPNHNAVASDAKPRDSRPLSGPEAEKTPQPKVLVSQTNRPSVASPRTSISANVKIFQGRAAEKPSPSEESKGTAVPECKVACPPSISAEPTTTQSPAAKVSPPVEKPANKADPKGIAYSSPPVSTTRQTSLMSRLAQSEDAVVCQPSIPTEPKTVQSPEAEQPDPAEEPVNQAMLTKKAGSAQPPSTIRQTSQSSLARKLAQPEKSADEAAPNRAAGTQVLPPANWQTSKSYSPKGVRQPEAPASATSQGKSPLEDSFVDISDEGGFLQRIKDKLLPSNGDDGSAKNKVMAMLVPILAIVMIFTFRQVLHKPPGKAKGAEKNDKTAIAAVKPSDEIVWTIPEPLPAMTRDPLKLSEPDEPENPDQTGTENPGQTAGQGQMNFLQVRAIVCSDDKATALIDNQIVRAGSKINGITIVKINRDSVELERNGETWVQKLRD